MVIVTPGKDVTLYIPADTPPEVIAYLNGLKADGVFSQGVMDILTRHILRQGGAAGTAPAAAAEAEAGDPRDVMRAEAGAASEAKYGETALPVEPDPDIRLKPLRPEEIIRQAARNAGKMLHDRQ